MKLTDLKITEVSILPDGTHGIGCKVTWAPDISATDDGFYPFDNGYAMGVDIAKGGNEHTVISVVRKRKENPNVIEVVDIRDVTKGWDTADLSDKYDLLNRIATHYRNLPAINEVIKNKTEDGKL